LRSAFARHQARAAAFLAELAEAHCVGEKSGSCGRFGEGKGHGMKTADGVVPVHRSVRPRNPPFVRCMSDQLDLDSVGIPQDNQVLVETAGPRRVDAESAQAPAPEVERALRNSE